MSKYAYRVTQVQAPYVRFDTPIASQSMSQFLSNLISRRESLGLEVKEITAELNRRGFDLAYSTVAGWFNGSRGERWKVDELMAILDILQTDLQSMAGGEAVLIEDPVPAQTAKEMRGLTPAQQQAILTMVKTMKGV